MELLLNLSEVFVHVYAELVTQVHSVELSTHAQTINV